MKLYILNFIYNLIKTDHYELHVNQSIFYSQNHG